MNIDIETILYEEESATLDFKSEQYPFSNCSDDDKSEMLKDLIAFANAWRRETAYIIVGVKKNPGEKGSIVGIKERIDDSRIQQFVNSKLNRPMNFTYSEFNIDEKVIGIYEIPIQERPFYLKKDFGSKKIDTVYIRRGSSTEIATPDEIAKMGREHIDISIPNIDFSFYDQENKGIIGNELHIQTILSKRPGNFSDFWKVRTPLLDCDPENISYFQKVADYIYFYNFFFPVYFCIENKSKKPLYNIHSLNFLNFDDCNISNEVPSRPRKYTSIYGHHEIPVLRSHGKSVLYCSINHAKKRYEINIQIDNIYGNEFIVFSNPIFFGSVQSKKMVLDFSFMGENVSEPVNTQLFLNIEVKEKEITIEDILSFDAMGMDPEIF